MELSRSFKRLNEYPPFLSIVHQKTKTSFYKQSRAFDFHMVSLKSRNLDKVVLRPSENLTKAAVALPSMLTASPCPSVTRGPLLLSPREASAGEVRPRGLWLLQPQAPSQSQAHCLPFQMLNKTETCSCVIPMYSGKRKHACHLFEDRGEEFK